LAESGLADGSALGSLRFARCAPPARRQVRRADRVAGQPCDAASPWACPLAATTGLTALLALAD